MDNPTKSNNSLLLDEICIILFKEKSENDESLSEWNQKLSHTNIKGTIKVIQIGNDWSETMEESKGQIIEPWTLLAPIQSGPAILEWIAKHASAIAELDGVTFRRKGTRSPLFLRLISMIFYQPFRFLLELPKGNLDSWLGWSNWKWELLGYWLFGVRNHDPLNPIRLLRTQWFQQIPYQSKTFWGNIEMLAKAHFLGARLAEELCPIQITLPPIAGNPWKDLTQLIQKPRFTSNQVQTDYSLGDPPIRSQPSG